MSPELLLAVVALVGAVGSAAGAWLGGRWNKRDIRAAVQLELSPVKRELARLDVEVGRHAFSLERLDGRVVELEDRRVNA